MAAIARSEHKSLSNWARFWRRFRRERLAILSALFLLCLMVVAIFRDQLMPYNLVESDFETVFAYPSREHWLGTDYLGRDLLSRLIYGTRLSMQASFLAVGVAALLGLPIGLLAGFIGGLFDRLVMWVVDLIFSLPGLLVAFAMVIILGKGLSNAMIGVGLVLATRYARLARGMVLAEREELYVDMARVGGLDRKTIIFKHILPNIAPALIVQTSHLFGAVILIEAGLGFIGIGANISDPSWGRSLYEARDFIITDPFLSMPPALAIILTVLAFNMLGDGLADALGRDRSSNQATIRPRKQSQERAARKIPIDKTIRQAALAVQGLEVRFPSLHGDDLVVLHDVSFVVHRGETLGLVGESGSGKSMTAFASMGLVPAPGAVTAGQIYLKGQEISGLAEAELRYLRGKEIAMIFQESITSLNPTLTIGEQLIGPMQRHLGLSKKKARQQARELLSLLRVPEPERRLDEYPHQYSGGMAQRAAIALALSCQPSVLIADEPTTALDVTLQGIILDLLKTLQKRLGLGILFITHDLGVVAEIADRVAVMYAGQLVEIASTERLFQRPKHPYTKALLDTLPHRGRHEGKLPVISGTVPPPSAWPTGCRFHPRCNYATEACMKAAIPLEKVGKDHFSRCVYAHEL